MKNKLIVIGIMIFAMLISIAIFLTFNTSSKTNYETKTSNGQATIDLTPKGIVNGKFTFDIRVNTHTINNLSQYDLKEYITLNYGEKSIKPVITPQLTGHHNSGSLVFDLKEVPKDFTVKIVNIPNINERVLEWK